MNWNQAPLLKALIPFIIGILFNVYIGSAIPGYLFIACGIPFLWLLLQLLWPDTFVTWRNRWTTGISIYILSFCCGYALTIVRTEINDNRHFSRISNATAFIGFIDQEPIPKKNSYKTFLQITAVKSDSTWYKTIGQCIAYFQKDSSLLHYGDRVEFTSQPQEISYTGSYRNYLTEHNFYHTVYLKNTEWKLIDHHHGNALIEKALVCRTKLLKVFRRNGIEGQDYAVLSAVTLGDESEINKETINAFADSGTMHILSVSGMHVMIIFIVLERLLFFMNRKRATKILKSIILILFLGSYALLSGLSPPALRSAAMLGLVVLGLAIDRQKNSWNIIAASGLILLCWNPLYIMDVGFQLSYLSIIGIILLYEKILNWFTIHNFILREVWSMASATLAAQLATFPLVMYYFHRFPNYFLFSNLVIIPLTAIIIYGGMVLLLFTWWQTGSLFIGKIVGWLVHLLNSTVLWIDHLPYAVINNIHTSALDTWLIYAAIVLSINFFFKKQPQFLIASLSTMCIMLMVQIAQLFI